MTLKILKTEKQYADLLAWVDTMLDKNIKPETPKGEMLELALALIKAYEDKHYPVLPPDPIEAIKLRMQEMKLSQTDLADIMGGKGKVSEVLNRKRKLTLPMIRNLTTRLRLSTDLLISDYRLG